MESIVFTNSQPEGVFASSEPEGVFINSQPEGIDNTPMANLTKDKPSKCTVCNISTDKLMVVLPCECSSICRNHKETIRTTKKCIKCGKKVEDIMSQNMYQFLKSRPEKKVILTTPEEINQLYPNSPLMKKVTLTNPFVN